MGSPIYSYSKIKNIENLGYDENGKSIQSVGPYTVTGSIVDQVDNANTIEVSDYGTESTYLNLISDLRKKYSDQYDDMNYIDDIHITKKGDAKLQLTNSNGEVTGTSEDASKKKNSFYYCGKDNSKKILFLDEEFNICKKIFKY